MPETAKWSDIHSSSGSCCSFCLGLVLSQVMILFSKSSTGHYACTVYRNKTLIFIAFNPSIFFLLNSLVNTNLHIMLKYQFLNTSFCNKKKSSQRCKFPDHLEENLNCQKANQKDDDKYWATSNASCSASYSSSRVHLCGQAEH